MEAESAAKLAVQYKDLVTAVWAVVSVLAGGIIFLLWNLVSGIRRKVHAKVDKEICNKEHDRVEKWLHKHPKDVEVIDR